MKYDLRVKPLEKPLKGSVKISGSKHLAIPLLTTAPLNEDVAIIKNTPKIKDTEIILECLKNLNCKISKNKNKIKINSKLLKYNELSLELISKVHGTLYLLPLILLKFKKVEIKNCFGGCDIGQRPILNIISPLISLGADIKSEKGWIRGSVEDIKPTKIFPNFSKKDHNKFISGYTKSAIMFSLFGKGTTKIYGYFKRYPIPDYVSSLNNMGAKIKMKKEYIEVKGVNELKKAKIVLPPDQIEIFTFICMVGICKGKIKLKNAYIDKDFEYERKIFEKIGIDIVSKNNNLIVKCDKPLKGVNVDTRKFHTDIQPLLASLMLFAGSKSRIRESVWEKRFAYVEEFRKMGAKIEKKGNEIIIFQNNGLKGSITQGLDLRTSVGLLLASLKTKDTNKIIGAHHIERGHENFFNKLKKLKINIEKIER